MELNDLNKITRSNKLNNLLNTRFGFDFDLSKMNETIANQMLGTANREMSEIAESSGDYQVNKKYLMSKLVKETIEAWQVENNLNGVRLVLEYVRKYVTSATGNRWIFSLRFVKRLYLYCIKRVV